jgi:hypothetical protein
MTGSDQNNVPAVGVQRTRLLADFLRSYVGLVPIWRAEYFDRAGGQMQQSVVIFAEHIVVVLEEVRARMTPTCVRAKVTKLDSDTEAKWIVVL